MSGAGLTPRSAELLRYVEGCVQTKGMAPTYEEMREHMNLRSNSTVATLIGRLQTVGRIRVARGRARAIEILPHVTHCPKCGEYLGVAP